MSVNEELLKSVLVDIAKLAGTTTIATECGVDFDSNECEAGACEYPACRTMLFLAEARP